MINPLKITLAGTVGVAALVLSSCAVQSPQARIERNPTLYEKLTPAQQGLVSRGQIAKGMPKPGVFLAMGNPDRRSRGHKGGRDYERWDYASLRPIYTHSLYGGYGYGYGYGWGCHRNPYYGLGYGPTVHYVRERTASVWFRDDEVESWEFGGFYP